MPRPADTKRKGARTTSTGRTRMKFRMKGEPRRVEPGQHQRGYLSRHSGRALAHRVFTNQAVMMFRQRADFDPEWLGGASPVLMHSTQSPPWVRKDRNRKRNRMQRASRQRNRRGV